MSKQRRSPEPRRRPYVQKRRAESSEETRRRIIEAAVALHQELGPLGTSISAVARRAGVQRLTVYRHFPDDASLVAACTRHYFGVHPPPDPTRWTDEDPEARLRRGLRELYAYWRETERMMDRVLRDYETDPERTGRGAANFMDGARGALVAAWSARSRRRTVVEACIGHAVDFRTWQSLVVQHGLHDVEAVELMTQLVLEAARP